MSSLDKAELGQALFEESGDALFLLDPETDRWMALPWDLDLTWADNMFGDGNEPFKSRVLSRPAFSLEYRNRLREIRDLLYNSDQAHRLIDELSAMIDDPEGGLSIADADRARWDFAPVMADASMRVSGTAPAAAVSNDHSVGAGRSKRIRSASWRSTTARNAASSTSTVRPGGVRSISAWLNRVMVPPSSACRSTIGGRGTSPVGSVDGETAGAG